MSISAEYAQEHINDPAVLCCRREAGTKLSHHDFEDPAIFDDLVSSGLLKLDGAITIGQAMGATLTKTLDSLNPILTDCVDKVQEAAAPAAETKDTVAAPASSSQGTTTTVSGGKLKIHIGEGKGIDLEIPVGLAGGVSAGQGAASGSGASAGAPAAVGEEKVVRTLTRKHYNITEVKRGDKTKIEGTTLYIRKGIEKEAVESQELVHALKLDIITKDKYHTYSETIMDTQPIATKEGDSELGSGVTRVLDNVVMLLTGTTDEGVQIGEFGSSEGYLDENVMWGRPSCPDYGDILIRGEVKIENLKNMERPGPLAAHKAFDVITQEIRLALKELDEKYCVSTEEFKQVRRPGKKKVALNEKGVLETYLLDYSSPPKESLWLPLALTLDGSQLPRI